jgi:peptidyl-prolyl cis-trans isomerase C
MRQQLLMKIKRSILYCLLSVLLSQLYLIHPFDSSAAGKIVAKVGDTEITESDLEEVFARYIPRGGFHGEIDPAREEEFRRKALNDIIDFELIYRESLKRKIEVSDDRIKEIVEINIKKSGSEKAFNEMLTKNELTMDTFRKKIRKYQMVNAVIATIALESEYSEKELKEYYEENKEKYKRPEALHLHQILLKVEPAAPEDEWMKKKEQAEQLLRRLREGEDFYDVAYQESEDQYRFKGGDLGFIHREMLTPKKLEDAAFLLKEGELSGVIRTIHGFHILKAGERNAPETLDFDEIKEKMKGELHKKRFEKMKNEMLENLKKEYPVEVYESTDDRDS